MPQPLASNRPNSKDANIRLDLRSFIKWIEQEFEPRLKRGEQPGQYARHPDDASIELYGVCDMASVLHTIDSLDLQENGRQQWAETINGFQTEAHGWYSEKDASHAKIHNTAYALSTLTLLGLDPAQPVWIDAEYRDAGAYLKTLDWKRNAYSESHFGAGIGSICALVDSLREPSWFASYFATCDSLFDPNNGLMGIDKPATGDTDQIGGTFHYAFLYDPFNRHLPFPEARIDAVLGLQNEEGHWDENNQLWLTMDALYLLTRTSRQTPYRFADIKTAARKVATLLDRTVFTPEKESVAFSGKIPTHSLCAAITAAAELQSFLGSHEIITERPLRNILDRRPFV